MTGTELAAAGDLLREVVTGMRENGSAIPDDEVLASLSATRELIRLASIFRNGRTVIFVRDC